MKKKCFALFMSLMLLLCFNVQAFAAERIPDASINATPGTELASASADFWYNTQLTLKVPSGKTAKHFGVKITPASGTATGANKFSVTPSFTSKSYSIPDDGKWYYFTILGVSGGNTGTYTVTNVSGDITIKYHVVIKFFT